MFNFFKKKKKSVAIVLSGGAARGIAHIGFLKALDENNIPIDAIYGTSVGAIVGALYCSGLPSARLAKIVRDTTLTDFIAFKLSKKALFSSEAIFCNSLLKAARQTNSHLTLSSKRAANAACS